MIRKPTDWKEVDSDFIPYDEKTLRVDFEELGIDKVAEFLPRVIEHGGEQVLLPEVFILFDTGGSEYVIDRSGYNYVRYIHRIK